MKEPSEGDKGKLTALKNNVLRTFFKEKKETEKGTIAIRTLRRYSVVTIPSRKGGTIRNVEN